MICKGRHVAPPHIWVQGEYLTKPPVRPSDGKEREVGNYIDKGGYPGANVYEVIPESICEMIGRKDAHAKEIFTQDILLYHYTECRDRENFTYLVVVQGMNAVDILTGEQVNLENTTLESVEIIGTTVTDTDFLESIDKTVSDGEKLPYVPFITSYGANLSVWRTKCRSCSYLSLNMRYKTICPVCGGVMDCTLNN